MDAHRWIVMTRQIAPKPMRLSDVASDQVAMSYDRRSDTLLTHFFGRDRDAINVPIGRYTYVLVASETDEVIGLHIEGFLAQAAKDLPDAVGLLDFADLRGMMPVEARAVQLATLGTEPARRLGFVEHEPRDFATQRWSAVTSFIAAAQARWDMPSLSAA